MKKTQQELARIVYDQMAKVGHALGDATRLRMLNLLMQSDRSVDDLSTMIGHSSPNTSAHLKVLQNARLVTKRREGRYVYYSMANPTAIQLWLNLRDMSTDELPEAREAMAQLSDQDTVVRQFDAATLLAQVRAGEVTILDLRPSEEYRNGHVPHAISIPFAELERRLHELEPTQTIVAYCRGPFCYGAIQGAALLKRNGFQVQRLYGGIGDWMHQGMDVASGHERTQESKEKVQ